MLWGAPIAFEVRAEDGATVLAGRFPYGTATDLGHGRREQFAGRAFSPRIETGENVFLLAGHDMEKPLASTESGSLTLRDDDEALHIEARVIPSTSWATDALAALAAGLTKGLSPGFRVAPDGETVTRSAGGMLRTVSRADLYEVSLVTRAAYGSAQIAARNWDASEKSALAFDAGLHRTLARWRA